VLFAVWCLVFFYNLYLRSMLSDCFVIILIINFVSNFMFIFSFIFIVIVFKAYCVLRSAYVHVIGSLQFYS